MPSRLIPYRTRKILHCKAAEKKKGENKLISNQVRHEMHPVNQKVSPRNYIDSKQKVDSQLFDLECFTSQSITESMFVEFLHEIMKQQTSLSVIDFRSLHSIEHFSALLK